MPDSQQQLPVTRTNSAGRFQTFLFLFLVFGIFSHSSFCLFVGQASAKSNSRFEAWDDAVFFAVAMKQGIAAAERLREAHDLVLENLDKSVQDKLAIANAYANSFAWVADAVLWNLEDYWATPFETITTRGGDCEDLALVKYAILRMMGVPDKKLGLAYMRNAENQHHMVLLYMDSPDTDVLILDNQHSEVCPSEKRKDIIGIYLIQNDGTLYLFENDAESPRKFKAKYENRKLSKWLGEMEREKRNNELFAQYNRGRPLLPE